VVIRHTRTHAHWHASISLPSLRISFFVDQVTWFYDSTTIPYGSSIYAHSAGQRDEICTGVKGHESGNEPCSLLAAADGWRYAIFPETKTCCRVCNVSSYCGIVSPGWLQTNASYQGEKDFPQADGSTVKCYGWVKQGGEQNFWFATATGLPCQYYEGYPSFAVGNNTWNFSPNAVVRSVPAGVFDVPTGCSAMCDLSEHQKPGHAAP
jgi:hypothetical protein